MKKKKKKPTKSRIDVRTIIVSAIVDFLVGLALLLIDKHTKANPVFYGRVHRPPIEYTFSSDLSIMLVKLAIFLIAAAGVKLIVSAVIYFNRKRKDNHDEER